MAQLATDATELFHDTGRCVFASTAALATRLDVSLGDLQQIRMRRDFPERGDIETVGDIDDHVEQIRVWTHKASTTHTCAKCFEHFTVYEWLHRGDLIHVEDVNELHVPKCCTCN